MYLKDCDFRKISTTINICDRTQKAEIEAKLVKAKQKQLINVGKLADKHQLTNWELNKLDKAFKFLSESKSDSFL